MPREISERQVAREPSYRLVSQCKCDLLTPPDFGRSLIAAHRCVASAVEQQLVVVSLVLSRGGFGATQKCFIPLRIDLNDAKRFDQNTDASRDFFGPGLQIQTLWRTGAR